MARKRYKPEEIVAKLRQVDVLVSQGQNMVDAIRQIGVSEVTYYRWRQEFGGLKTEQVKRLKDLELENSRLRKAVSCLEGGYHFSFFSKVQHGALVSDTGTLMPSSSQLRRHHATCRWSVLP
jgi:hypothetical protein